MHCILVHLFRGTAGPQVSILNSEVWNRKFRNLGFEIPKLWIPKTAQDCCEKVNGTLDWGIPKILIASWIPKIEQFQKPLLPNKCLLIVPIPIFAVSSACPLPLSVQRHVKFHCNLKTQLFSAQQNTVVETESPELTFPLYLQRSVHNGTVCSSFLNSLFCPIQVTTPFQVTMCA